MRTTSDAEGAFALTGLKEGRVPVPRGEEVVIRLRPSPIEVSEAEPSRLGANPSCERE